MEYLRASRSEAGVRLQLWGPRVLFVVFATLLTYKAATGVSVGTLYVYCALFLASAILYVARQLRRGHMQADQDSVRLAGVVLIVTGLAALAAYLWVKADALPVVGVVLVLLGLGWWVEACRATGRVVVLGRSATSRTDRSALGRWGLGLAAGGASVAVAGWVFLGRWRGGGNVPMALLVGLVFVFVLVGTNFVSEWALARVRSHRRRHERLSTMQRVSFVVLGVVAVGIAALYLWDWVLTASLAALVVVFVLALVSDTHADVALALLVVVIVGSAPPEVPLPSVTRPVTSTLVALGDSYMAGEGARIYFEGTDDAGDDECRRSPTSYAVGTVLTGSPFQRLVFLACSGARTANVVASTDDPDHAYAQPGEQGTQITQLAALLRQDPTLRPNLVIISIGGNDAGFGTIAETCLMPGDCADERSLFEGTLPEVEKALDATYASLRRALPGVPVVSIPYPQPFADARTCPGVALTDRERAFIRTFVDELDARVQAASTRAGVFYLDDMKSALADAGLQLCTRTKAQAGVNFVDVESVNGLANDRFNPGRWLHNSLHPNARGHAAMQAVLARWLEQHASSVNRATAAAPSSGPAAPVIAGAVVAAQPQCSITDPTVLRCQDLARRWWMSQLWNCWPWFLALALCLLLLLVASVGAVSALGAFPSGTPSPDRSSSD